MTLQFDMYQTVAIAVLVWALGVFLKKQFKFLDTFCIPAPVVGGVIFSLLVTIFKDIAFKEISFDGTLQMFFMMIFFTTIGFTANIRLLKKGGIQVVTFLGVASLLVVLQNSLGISIGKLFDLNPLISLSASSVPMVGGHGTSGAFGPLFESFGATGATTVAMASATFGLVMGSLIGGPIARRRINMYNLHSDKEDLELSLDHGNTEVKSLSKDDMLIGFAQIFLALGVGTIMSKILGMTGMAFPVYIGSMFGAAIIKNLAEYSGKFATRDEEIGIIGDIMLTFFLVMALMTLKLWQLADLALPLITILAGQTVLTAAVAYFVCFRVMGSDYEAAVMSAGMCGFGMGATPNAMANMNALAHKFGPAPRAFFILPIVGSLFIDFVNASMITFFMNIFK